MPIRYTLRENRLTADPDDYVAKVIPSRTVELEEVVERMVERGSTTKKADILGVLEDLERVIESLLLERANVNLPFANFSSSMKGVFNRQTDSFDANRHQVVPVVNPGKQLREAYRSTLGVRRKSG